MSSPFSDAKELGVREKVYFVAISTIVVILEGVFDEIVGFQVPLEQEFTVIVNPDELSVSRNRVREKVRVLESVFFQDFSISTNVGNTFLSARFHSKDDTCAIKHGGESQDLLELFLELEEFFVLKNE